jgi:hypothetical protein
MFLEIFTLLQLLCGQFLRSRMHLLFQRISLTFNSQVATNLRRILLKIVRSAPLCNVFWSRSEGRIEFAVGSVLDFSEGLNKKPLGRCALFAEGEDAGCN